MDCFFFFFLIISISTLDPDDPLADLLEDLLPDEPKASSKSITQQPRPDKPSTPPAASLDFNAKTSKSLQNPQPAAALKHCEQRKHATFDCVSVSKGGEEPSGSDVRARRQGGPDGHAGVRQRQEQTEEKRDGALVQQGKVAAAGIIYRL